MRLTINSYSLSDYVAPIAVLAPSASTSHPMRARSNSKQKLHEEEDVVDDWETAV
jgi:hypothetical protein